MLRIPCQGVFPEVIVNVSNEMNPASLLFALDRIVPRVKVCNQNTGELMAYVRMRPGDVCAMPADIQHQGFASERSMLLVWENADPKMPEKIRSGAVPGDPDKMVTMK